MPPPLSGVEVFEIFAHPAAAASSTVRPRGSLCAAVRSIPARLFPGTSGAASIWLIWSEHDFFFAAAMSCCSAAVESPASGFEPPHATAHATKEAELTKRAYLEIIFE